MQPDYTLQRIIFDKYTDEDWRAYFDFRTAYANSINESLPFESWQYLKERSLLALKEGVGLYLLWRDGAPAGHFSFDTQFPDQADKRFVYFRRQQIHEPLNDGFLPLVFKAFLDFDPKARFLTIKSLNGAADFLAERFGAKIGGNAGEFELLVEEADTEVIGRWLEEFPRKFPNYRMKFYVDIPDDLLEEYAAVFTELLADMPANSEPGDHHITAEGIKARQERSRKRQYCSYKYLIFNEKDQLIAKTNVAVNLKNTKVVYQYMTGTLRAYRRQGLGKWLKAMMFKKLVEDFPDLEKIETETHPDNAGSIGLSRQMGFRKTGSYKEFLVPRAAVEDFVVL